MSDDTNGVPLIDLSKQYNEVKEDVDRSLLRVIESGRFILGPEVSAFEGEMADYLGSGNCVGVGSGTDALYLAMKALGIGPGDEVVTTPFTFIATADTIFNCGARPVFADIDPGTFNLDPESVEGKLTPETRAVVVVHLFGQPADLGPILELTVPRGIHVIEDCAQALGAEYRGRKVGTFGVAGTFSFFPTKPLGGFGDGGMVCTADRELADRVRMLRVHGSREKYISDLPGINSRLDEIQAAALRVKLGRLDAWNEERREIASVYDENILGATVPSVARGVSHVYHQYTIRTGEREAVVEHLTESNVGSSVYYPVPLHLQPCFSGLGYGAGDLPESETACREVLSLPIFSGMSIEQVERVYRAVNRAGA